MHCYIATPLVAAKNDFPRSHLHHIQYYVTDYIPAAQTNVNNFARPSPPLQSGSGNETSLTPWINERINWQEQHLDYYYVRWSGRVIC